MGVWGLDIYDDDLAKDIKEEFEGYLIEGMDEWDALEETISNNDDLLNDDEVNGTFILAVASLAKENDITNKKISKMLKNLDENKEYWDYIKEDSQELYEARIDLLRDLYK